MNRGLFLFICSACSVTYAGQVTAILNVNATVQASCMIYEIKPIEFGVYNPYESVAKDAIGSVSVACSRDTSIMSIEIGQGGSADAQKMLGQGQKLDYYLYQDQGRNVIWGSGEHRFIPSSQPGAYGEVYPIWARIPPGQQIENGSFNDFLVITVTF